MDISNLTIEDLANGYHLDQNKSTYNCNFCDAKFNDGQIYPIGELFYDAKKAVSIHISSVHHSVIEGLLSDEGKIEGLTDKQSRLIKDLSDGLNDSEIAKLHGLSQSTVRYQRFKLREKHRHAKLLVAAYRHIENVESNAGSKLVEPHLGAKMVDERYLVTEQESQKIIDTYFKRVSGQLTLISLPAKEKKKIVVLRCIASSFDEQKNYTEKEINKRIKVIFDDIATIRRYLIQYGFMSRKKDGSEYWFNHG